MAGFCTQDLDDVWGPVVDECRRTFDFTLLFEQSILSTLPLAIFLTIALLRIWRLLRREQILTTGLLGLAKVTLIFSVGGSQLALLVLWSRDSEERTRISIAMVVISLIGSLVMTPLSWLEHTRTIKPSLLICSFLLLTTVLDMAQLRTLWTMPNGNRPIAALFTTSYALRIGLLSLESSPKKLTRAVDIARSPEDKCGVISRSFFLWLVPLIYAGFRKTLDVGDLYAPPVDAAPQVLEEKLWQQWRNCEHLLLVGDS